ncbi:MULTISPECIES: hypothetical protein [unclassified Myroides]|uniref:hypothetical protein n=1 Tax=unclassified Myroides TaxID=2642485 RepID=UPI003100CAF3
MTQLTEQQVQQIHLFVKKHYVEHYDVELELVDHLANGIEQQWAIDNNITFDNALQIEFKKFGVYGFSDVVELKAQSLTLQYIKNLLKDIKCYFKWHRIVVSMALYSVIYALLKYTATFIHTRDIADIFILSTLVFNIIWASIDVIKTKRRNKSEGRKWILDKVKFQFIAFPTIIFFVYFRMVISIFHRQTWLVASAMLFIILWYFISVSVIYPTINNEREVLKKKLTA